MLRNGTLDNLGCSEGKNNSDMKVREITFESRWQPTARMANQMNDYTRVAGERRDKQKVETQAKKESMAKEACADGNL